MSRRAEQTEVRLVGDLLAVLCPAPQVARELVAGGQVETRHQELGRVGGGDQTVAELTRLEADVVLRLRVRRCLVLQRGHVPLGHQVGVALKLLLGVLVVLAVVACGCRPRSRSTDAVE